MKKKLVNKIPKLSFGSRGIGKKLPPLIIAEMSGNHNQSLKRALEIVEAAAKAGVHAIKLQTYTADTMTLNLSNDAFSVNDPDSLWAGRTLYELYDEAHTPWEWHEAIFNKARELGIIAFSTPFDDTAVDFLESLNVPFYKIASQENTDINLIRRVAGTGKPIIISTGMATQNELTEAVEEARDAGCEELTLLKCTSTYPASPENTNISTIPELRRLFNCEIGLSDHTMGIGVSIASVAMGASIIEKHMTLSRKEGGVDSDFSMEPHEMNNLVIVTERVWRSYGTVSYGATEAEKKSLKYRRSLYITHDMKAGEVLSAKNLRAIRPGYGLETKYLNELLGQKVNRDLIRGTPMNWDFVKK
jgi:pseudaminic acid synthase